MYNCVCLISLHTDKRVYILAINPMVVTPRLNQSVISPSVWILTVTFPPDADDIYRQMCRIHTARNRIILIDFLDLSHSEDAESESPYCVYWQANYTCAEKAFQRQTFEVSTTSTSSRQIPSFTLFFWSNNYTTTTTARIWINIQGNESAMLSLFKCGK